MTNGEEHICVTTDEGERLFDELWERLSDGASPRIEQELKEDYDLELIGEGDYRVAFIDEGGAHIQQAHACVVKIHKYHEVEHNRAEVSNYQKVNDDVRHHLLPPTDYPSDYKWIVTPLVSGEPTPEQLYEMEKILVENGWYYDDVREGNVAVSGGRPILIDYGHEFERLDTDIMGIDERLATKRWKWGIE